MAGGVVWVVVLGGVVPPELVVWASAVKHSNTAKLMEVANRWKAFIELFMTGLDRR